MHLTLHTDGGSRGNPGPAGVGVVLADAADGQAVHEAGHFVGHTTNNVAEYTGLIRGLEAAQRLGATKVSVRSDSELMVRQVKGEYRVKAAQLKPLHAEVMQLLGAFDEGWDIGHVRREGNQRADALANLAMDARADVEG